MLLSSEETTVFMRHFVIVILCGNLSGMQGGIKIDASDLAVSAVLHQRVDGEVGPISYY